MIMLGSPLRITHVITGLNTGGAESMLYRLLSHSDMRTFQHEVISLSGDGPIGTRIRNLNIPVFPIKVRRLASVPKMLCAVAMRVQRSRPDVVHTWMYHSDLVGGIAAKLFSSAKIVWHIHHKDLMPPLIKARTRHVARACARLSRSVPDKIICSSNAALKTHANFGYEMARMLTIPNGFDLNEFHPSPQCRAKMRAELGIPESSVTVGLIGRFVPIKGHTTFLSAAGLIRRICPDTNFLLCGEGVTVENRTLMEAAMRAGVVENCRILGRREDMPEVFSALDIVVSSSFTESLPCVVGEAMAMEIPCVVTDVGDSALVVGNTGRVVPPQSPELLADACLDLIQMSGPERRLLGSRARDRIRLEFSLCAMVEQVETLYRQLCPYKPEYALSEQIP